MYRPNMVVGLAMPAKYLKKILSQNYPIYHNRKTKWQNLRNEIFMNFFSPEYQLEILLAVA